MNLGSKGMSGKALPYLTRDTMSDLRRGKGETKRFAKQIVIFPGEILVHLVNCLGNVLEIIDPFKIPCLSTFVGSNYLFLNLKRKNVG